MTLHTNIDGSYDQSSFKFEPFNLTSIAMYVDGHCLGTPIECDFSNANNNIALVSRAYDSIFSAASGLDDVGNDISVDDYVSNGYTLFAFNLDNDTSSDTAEFLNPIKRGEISLSLSFASALTHNIAVVCYMEYLGLVEIDRARNVIFNK
jgi:hypothetical protein